MGLVPGGTYRNKEFYVPNVEVKEDVSPYLIDILFDPQTSGGLLISVQEEEAEALLRSLQGAGLKDVSIIAEVVTEPQGRIILV